MRRSPRPGRGPGRLSETRETLEDEARAELAFHVDSEIDRLMAEGHSRSEAQGIVLADLGDVEGIGSRCASIAWQSRRRSRLRSLWHSGWSDLRLGFRSLRRHRVHAIAATATLALGIGASTTLLSVVDAVAWRDLPYPDSDRLVRVAGTFPTGGMGPVPGPFLQGWREASTTLELLAAALVESRDLTPADGEPVRLRAAAVSEEYGALTGLDLALGRWFGPEEGGRNDARLAVLSHGLWMERWGGDPAILGTTVSLDGEPVTVIGVASERHLPPLALNLAGVDVWVPLPQAREDVMRHDLWMLRVAARHRAGVEVEAVRAEVQAITDRLIEGVDPEHYESGFRIQVDDLRRNTTAASADAVGILLGAAVLLLLAACANVANLSLARGRSRVGELGVRRSLGASRLRLIRMLTIETGVTALLGGLLGLGLARAGIVLFRRFDPGDLPRVGELVMDLRVVGIAFGVVVVAALASGLLPAFQLSRRSGPVDMGRSTTSDRGAARLRGALVAVEVAMALALLTGSALLGRSLWELVRVDPGFEAAGAYALHLELAQRYDSREARVRFFRDVAAELGSVPGVEAVGMGNGLPFGQGGAMGSVVVGDGASDAVPDYVRWQLVDAGFFPTLSVGAVEGRLLTAGEVARGATRVVVNRTFARTVWGAGPAVGRSLKIVRTDDDDPWLEVVGVVDDFRQGRLDRDVVPEIYIPLGQSPVVFASMDFVVRSSLPLESLAPALRAALWRLDDDQPVGWTDSLDGRIRGSLARHRFYGALLAVFAASAILLVVAGIYGTVAAGIGQRRRELGVRMALGATGGRITGEVARRSLGWMAVGLVVGTAGSVGAGRLVGTLLYGVGAHDGLTFLLAALTLAAIGAVAVLIPALRVTRIDPVDVLRA